MKIAEAQFAEHGLRGLHGVSAEVMFVALLITVGGSPGAPLITAMAGEFGVSLTAAQWTLTAPLLVGAGAAPVLGRLGGGPRRRVWLTPTTGTGTSARDCQTGAGGGLVGVQGAGGLACAAGSGRAPTRGSRQLESPPGGDARVGA